MLAYRSSLRLWGTDSRYFLHFFIRLSSFLSIILGWVKGRAQLHERMRPPWRAPRGRSRLLCRARGFSWPSALLVSAACTVGVGHGSRGTRDTWPLGDVPFEGLAVAAASLGRPPSPPCDPGCQSQHVDTACAASVLCPKCSPQNRSPRFGGFLRSRCQSLRKACRRACWRLTGSCAAPPVGVLNPRRSRGSGGPGIPGLLCFTLCLSSSGLPPGQGPGSGG